MANWLQNLTGSLLNEAYKDQAEQVHKARLAETLANQMKLTDYQNTIDRNNLASDRIYAEGIAEKEAKAKSIQDQIDYRQGIVNRLIENPDKYLNAADVAGQIQPSNTSQDVNAILRQLQFRPEQPNAYQRWLMGQGTRDEQRFQREAALTEYKSALDRLKGLEADRSEGLNVSQLDYANVLQSINNARENMRSLGIKISGDENVHKNVKAQINDAVKSAFGYNSPTLENALNGGKSEQQTGLKVGTIEEGYKYLGGDPADPNNWEKQ